MQSKLINLVSKLRAPIFQAPMAGGINTPVFVSEVIKSGGVGSFGFGYSQPKDIDKSLTDIRKLSPVGLLNANFFIYPIEISPINQQLQHNAVKSICEQAKIDASVLSAPLLPYFPDLKECLEPIWQHRPDVLTFHFGIPPWWVIDKANENGILVGVTASTPEEALLIQQSGADFIVAQGIEAGGHRGTFKPSKITSNTDTKSSHAEGLSTLDLVKSITQGMSGHAAIPVVAAGGVMNGGDIHTMISAGAVAVQMGTAFLLCHESNATKEHKHIIEHEHTRQTVTTTAFSGRLARCFENEFVKNMRSVEKDGHILPFPVQNTLTGGMRKLAVSNHDGEYQSLYTGVNFKQARRMSTADLMDILVREYEEARKV